MNDIDLLKEIEEKLSKLSDKERERIVNWLSDKYLVTDQLAFAYPQPSYWTQPYYIYSHQDAYPPYQDTVDASPTI